MNRHELIDTATIRLSALLQGEAKFCAPSVDAPPLVDVTTGTTPPVDDVGILMDGRNAERAIAGVIDIWTAIEYMESRLG